MINPLWQVHTHTLFTVLWSSYLTVRSSLLMDSCKETCQRGEVTLSRYCLRLKERSITQNYYCVFRCWSRCDVSANDSRNGSREFLFLWICHKRPLWLLGLQHHVDSTVHLTNISVPTHSTRYWIFEKVCWCRLKLQWTAETHTHEIDLNSMYKIEHQSYYLP